MATLWEYIAYLLSPYDDPRYSTYGPHNVSKAEYVLHLFVSAVVTRFAMHLRWLVLTILVYLVLGFSLSISP